jgi:hypothetical protein
MAMADDDKAKTIVYLQPSKSGRKISDMTDDELRAMAGEMFDAIQQDRAHRE